MVFDCVFLVDGSPCVDSIHIALSKYLAVLQNRLTKVDEPALFTCLAILEDDLVELIKECEYLLVAVEETETAEIESLECRALTVCEELNDLLGH